MFIELETSSTGAVAQHSACSLPLPQLSEGRAASDARGKFAPNQSMSWKFCFLQGFVY